MLTEGDKQLGNKGIHKYTKLAQIIMNMMKKMSKTNGSGTLGNVSLRYHLIGDMKNRKVTVMQGN